VDLQHLYIDGSKFEANANKYTWVWKKATEKSRYRLFEKITALFQEINEELAYTAHSIVSIWIMNRESGRQKGAYVG